MVNGVVTSNWPLLTSQRQTQQHQSKLWFCTRFKWVETLHNLLQTNLTVPRDLELFGLFLVHTQQHTGGMEVVSCFTVLQELQHCLNLLPARTQDHCCGLQTETNWRCSSKTAIRSLKVRWSCTVSEMFSEVLCLHSMLFQTCYTKPFSSQTTCNRQKLKPLFCHHSVLFD